MPPIHKGKSFYCLSRDTMRFDRLTAKLQEAVSDAQSLAVGKDNSAIEPGHVLAALLDQQGGSVRPLLAQAGADTTVLGRELSAHLDNLPRLKSPTGEVAVGQELN
ncbi:MAG: Clp protease N-terminal domain-containing protein, partial [Moraxellaceae bacterium]